GGLRVRYAPPPAAPLARAAAAAMLDRTHFDPLGHPMLSQLEFERLVSAYAPSFDVELAGDYDRFGLLRWQPEAAMPEVDPAEAGAGSAGGMGIRAANAAAGRRGRAPGGENCLGHALHRRRKPGTRLGQRGALRAPSVRRAALDAAHGRGPPQRLRAGWHHR